MTVEYFGHQQEFMISFLTKETAYGTAPAVSSATTQKVIGYNMTPESTDIVTDDVGEVHGSEIPTTQEITESGGSFPMEFPKVTPNYLAALAALALGTLVSTKDGAFAGYQHYITMNAANVALPSVAAWLKMADQQRKYVGIKAGNIDLASEESGYVSLNCGLMHSGQVTESSETLQAAVEEVTMRAADTKVYLQPSPNPASDIIAPANFSQITDNISAAQNLTDLGDRVTGWNFTFNNNLTEQRGHGGQGFDQDINFGAREITVELNLRFKDKTEYDQYTAQTTMALEFNNARLSSLIDAAGAFYYGFILRIPKIQLKAKPIAQGGVSDPLAITLTGTVLDDGTNKFFDLAVYNAIAAYLA